MTKFYYSSVSNSAKKRVEGIILAENEKEAREKLNKIGMAILSIATEKSVGWEDANAFEFLVIQKNDEEFSGEILAENEDEVFDRLAEEFNFKKINYISRSDASEEEKMQARESGVKKIILKQRKEEEEKEEMENRTLSGGIKTLVKMGSKKNDENEKERLRLENLKKFSDKGEDVTDSANSNVEQVISSVEVVDMKEEKKPTIQEKIKELQEKLKTTFKRFSEKSSKFYFLLTEIVVPPKGKTRQDGWSEMKIFISLSKKIDLGSAADEEKSVVMRHKAIFERFWIAFEEIVDVLAAVFLVYFAIGTLALYIYIPRITDLAEQTLKDNAMIPFLVGVFIFVRLLILLREKFTSWSPLRTSLLFFSGGLVIVFAGVNLL